MTNINDTSAELEKLDIVVELPELHAWKQVKSATEKIIWTLKEDIKTFPESVKVNEAILALAEQKLKELDKK